MYSKKTKLQEIKDRLNIENISFEEREKLFKDMRRAGGKIVELKYSDDPYTTFKIKSDSHRELMENNALDDSKKKTGKIIPHNIRAPQEKENPFRTKNKPLPISSNSKKQKTDINKNSGNSLFFFWVKFNCFIGGLTSWNAKYFSHRFITRMLDNNLQKIMRIHLLLEPIFKPQNSKMAAFRQIILDEHRLMDYEFTYHTYKLFDLKHFQNLQTELNISVLDAEETLKAIFKKLYLFNRYQSQLKISTMLILQKFKQQFPETYSINPSVSFDKIWSSLIVSLYFELEQMMEFYMAYHNNSNHTYSTLEQYLQIDKQSIVLGALSQEWKKESLLNSLKSEEQETTTESDQEEQETTTSLYPNSMIQEGVEFLLQNINYLTLFEQFKSSPDLRSHFNSDDKLFYTYVLLDYLDKEFSILWTGDVVQYYTVADGTSVGRFDAKKEAVTLYHKLNSAHELINDYLRQKHDTEKMIDRTYDKKNLVIQQHIKELSRSSFNIRQNIQTAIYEFMLLIDKINKSLGTQNPFIGNIEQIINLSRTYSNRIINGMTVKNALLKVNQIMTSVLWLLKNGDLSGTSANISSVLVMKDVIERLGVSKSQ
ncbi:MAG: hypothetical protein ACRCV0_00605 [Brevinema sp.]